MILTAPLAIMGVMESRSPEPGKPDFVVDYLLHPSMYTEVPDPAWPTGLEQRVGQQVEAQWAVLRKAETAAHGGRDARAFTAAVPSADPWWPGHVRATWESYRQARMTADRIIDAADRLPATEQGEAAADDAWWHAYIADHDSDVAYEQFSAAWGDWRREPEISAEPDEPEAGE
jgi:hypothetical protein